MDEEKPFSEQTFNEALAAQANKDKSSMVLATLQAFRDGEPAAFKLVSQAMLEHKYAEENKFPVGDERFKEIIQLAAGAIQRGEI